MFKTLILSIFAIKSPSTNNLPHFWPKVQILFPPHATFLKNIYPCIGPFKALKLNIWIPIIPLLGHYLVLYLVWEIISERHKYLIWLKSDLNLNLDNWFNLWFGSKSHLWTGLPMYVTLFWSERSACAALWRCISGPTYTL